MSTPIPFGTVEQDYAPIDGMRIHVSPVNRVTLVDLHYYADPAKCIPTPEEWLKRATQGMSDGAIKREYLLDRNTPSGDAFYFEWNDNGGRERYVVRCPGFIQGLHISRSFDFGVRRPACIWYQYDPGEDIIWYLREFMAHDCGTHDFRDTVAFLSGELPYEELTGDARYWADEVQARTWNHPAPWFDAGTHFVNFSGPEAFRRQAAAMRNPLETTDADIMAAGGIQLTEWNGPVLARTSIMRRLMKVRESGYPGALFDPSCEELIRAMSGALVFHPPTEEDPIPNRPKKDGHFDNIHDAATYGLAHEVTSVDKVMPPPPNRVSYHNRMRVEEDRRGHSIGWKETRHGW
jgi:hypothetical protein